MHGKIMKKRGLSIILRCRELNHLQFCTVNKLQSCPYSEVLEREKLRRGTGKSNHISKFHRKVINLTRDETKPHSSRN